MAIVTETIQVTVTGANPQTFTKTVQVDTATGAGTGPVTIPLTGVNAGTDTIQCTMPSHAGVPASNQSTLVWQATNSPIANGPITIDVYFSNGTRGWPGSLISGAGSFGNVYPHLNAAPGANSLVFNQVFPNYPIPNFNNQPTNIGPGGGYKLCPMVVVNQTATGQFTGVSGGPGQPIAGTNDGANGHADNGSDHHGYLLDVYGTLVVKTAGTYTFYGNMCNEGSLALWIPGVTVSSRNGDNTTTGGGNNPFPAASPKFGYTPLCLAEIDHAENAPVTSAYITFPKAGSYPFEWVCNQHDFQQFSGDNNGYFQITYLSGTQNQSVGNGNGNVGVQPFPVSIATAPPPGSTPTGQLRLTPVGGSANLVTQGQTTNLTLTVQNIVYTSIPYVPLLEGTSGYLTVTNSGANFAFPTFNGNPVNTTAAESAVFAITANNSAIAGLFTVTNTGAAPAPFRFNYNGGAFSFATPGAQVSSSQVTVAADDIAWFDPTGNKFDTYNGGAGSTSFSFDVDYMTKPSVASVSPGTLNASGIAQAVQINLNKPMSPMQQGLYGTGNTVNITGSATGGATVGAFTPILDSGGFLQGWSTTITPPVSSTNGSTQLSLNVNGTLTYLSGNTFVTTTVSYINGVVATINTLGGFQAPVGVSLSTNPASTSLATTATTEIIGTEYTHDNPSSCTMQFFKKFISSGTRVNLGTPQSVPINAITTTVGGQTVYQKTYHVTGIAFPAISGTTTAAGQINLGFDVTDNTTGLTTTYQSTTVYQEQVTITGGGGGCFSFSTLIQTPDGFVPIGLMPWDKPFEIVNETGTHYADLIVHEEYDALMIDLGKGMLVTLDHMMKDGDKWVEAGDKYVDSPRIPFHGTVYNLHVRSDNPEDQHYVLSNGDVAHNIKAFSCFTEYVEIETPDGLVAFGELPQTGVFEIVNKTGVHNAELLVNPNYAGWMLDFGGGKLVTISHKMELKPGRWVRAEEMYPHLPRVWFEGAVYNLHVHGGTEEDHHYILFNGDVAHNVLT